MEHQTLPIACTLGPDDGRTRMLRWKRLRDLGIPVAHLDGGHLEVRFRSGPGIQEELTSLADAERACCSFAQWTVTMDDQPTLHIIAAPEALAPIAAMFGVDTSNRGA